jgi:hypothetical protein
MLPRGAHPLHSIITAGRVNKRHLMAPYIHHRRLSRLTFRKPNAGSIKKYETEIKGINANSSLSAEFKYRNSVHLFARIDLCKKNMEVEALRAKLETTCNHQNLNAFSENSLAKIKGDFHAGSLLFKDLAHLQWRVFKLSVFSPWGDVALLERVVRFPHFGLQICWITVARVLLRVAIKFAG